MEHHLREKIAQRAKQFKKWELIIMLAIVALLFAGIVYYSISDKMQFERMLRDVQKRLTQGEIKGEVVIGAPQGIVPMFRDMLHDCDVVELGVVHPAGDARRNGCECFLAEQEISESELGDTGYRLAEQKGDYRLYVTVMEPGDWKITQYGTVSGLQSMCYSLVSEDGMFILLDGGHDVDEENLRELIKVFDNRVDLWICSHFHEDHIGAITKMLPSLQKITISELWCPPMDIETYKSFAKDWDSIETCETFLKEIAKYEKTEETKEGEKSAGSGGGVLAAEKGGLKKVVRIQDGDELDVSNLHFTFFSAYSDGAEWTHEGNNCGFIFQVKGKNETMLFCCDVGNDWMSERLIAGHGDNLKSDYVQMGHHGNGGLSEEAYRLVAPGAAFFDGPGWLFADEEKYTAAKNRRLMESMGAEIYLLDEAPNSILLR